MPLIWAALARLGWSHSELARRLEINKAMAAKILYGDRRAGRDLAVKFWKVLDVPIEAWSQPIVRGWKPAHSPVSRNATTRNAA